MYEVRVHGRGGQGVVEGCRGLVGRCLPQRPLFPGVPEFRLRALRCAGAVVLQDRQQPNPHARTGPGARRAHRAGRDTAAPPTVLEAAPHRGERAPWTGQRAARPLPRSRDRVPSQVDPHQQLTLVTAMKPLREGSGSSVQPHQPVDRVAPTVPHRELRPPLRLLVRHRRRKHERERHLRGVVWSIVERDRYQRH